MQYDLSCPYISLCTIVSYFTANVDMRLSPYFYYWYCCKFNTLLSNSWNLSSNYVEIKCQLDATDDIYCRFYCMLNMFRGNTMPIIRSSRILYRWSLPVVFGALVFRLSVWCGAEGYVGCCSGLQTGHITFNSTPYRQPENQSTKYHRQRPSV